MSKSIRVTMTRPTTLTIWPFDLFPWMPTLSDNFLTFEGWGVESYINGNEDTDLTVVVDHYFATTESFDSLKDAVYDLLPLWCNSSNRTDSESYCVDNNVTVSIVEIDNPDLSAYTKLTVTHSETRTFDALRAIE